MLHWLYQNQMTAYHVVVIIGVTWINVTLVKIRAYGVGIKAANAALKKCSEGGVDCPG